MGKKRAVAKRAGKCLSQAKPLRRSKRLNPLYSTPALSHSPSSIIFLSSDDSALPENASLPAAFPHESSPPRTPLVASPSSSPPRGSPLRTPLTTPVHPSTSNQQQPPSPTDEMKELASFIIDSLSPKFLILSAQHQELREEVAALRSQNAELQEKLKSFEQTVSSKAIDMSIDIQKMMAIIQEDRSYGVEGIAKEVGSLKGRIAGAVEDFRKMLSTFEDSQIHNLKQLLNSIATMIDPRAAPPPNDG